MAWASRSLPGGRQVRIGIDLGGTKTEGIVMDSQGNIRATIRKPTPAAAGYEAILRNIEDIVNSLEQTVAVVCSIGVGTPGSLSANSDTLKNSNTTCMNGRPLKRDLENVLGREVRLENDANCFALSEAVDGAAENYALVFGVIMGTGVGGGIVFNKHLHSGLHHIAGEWGHNILNPAGNNCYCGRRGCVETYLSGPGFMNNWRQRDSRVLALEQIVALAESGDQAAKSAMREYLKNFALALSTVINILDPDIIVLGGGMSNIGRLYTEGVDQVAGYVFNNELNTPIVKNRHGDSSGVRGAARLW